MERAAEVLRRGIEEGRLFLPHQVLVEFVAATTRRRGPSGPILELPAALAAVEEFLLAYEILYPTDVVVRSATVGAVVHRLPWYDAHLWAYADAYGINEILTEDTPSRPRCGTVLYTNPFRDL
jgi:predicted nucleic acid-binding protein